MLRVLFPLTPTPRSHTGHHYGCKDRTRGQNLIQFVQKSSKDGKVGIYSFTIEMEASRCKVICQTQLSGLASCVTPPWAFHASGLMEGGWVTAITKTNKQTKQAEATDNSDKNGGEDCWSKQYSPKLGVRED